MSESIYFLSTLPLSNEQFASLEALSTRLDIHVMDESPNEGLTAEQWAQVEILYTAQLLPEPGQAPALSWIQFYFAGIDAFADAPILQQADLAITMMSGANAPQVAEHALALLLGLGHNLPTMFADQAASKWATRRAERYQPKELFGSTVGIVGYGSIGRQLGKLLQSFNCTVLASKRDLKKLDDSGFYFEGEGDPQAELPRRLYPNKALGSMLKDCDFVVVCAPLNAETRGMLSTKQFEAMKPDALLVDVSRGGVCDHEALIQALNKGRLAGAALDVFPEEPLPSDSPLWEMPNVIVSPHVAGLSAHYAERAFAVLKENLARYLEERDLVNQINLERGY